MEHSVGVSQLDLVRPWRRATYIAGAVAGVELLLLLILGGIVIGPAIADALTGVAEGQVVAQAKQPKTAVPLRPKKVRAVASLPRGKTKVVVLNGNGRTGAAGEAADRVRARGYRIGVVGNADRSDYARSLSCTAAASAARPSGSRATSASASWRRSTACARASCAARMQSSF